MEKQAAVKKQNYILLSFYHYVIFKVMRHLVGEMLNTNAM